MKRAVSLLLRRSTRRGTMARPSQALSLTVSVVLISSLLASFFAFSASAVPDPIQVTMTPSVNPVASGASLTWTIQAVNSEPNLKTVRLTDQLTGLKNIVLTSSRGYCTESNLLVTCEAGSMPGHNSVWTVTVRGIVTAPNGDTLHNTATVTGRQGGQDFAVPGTASVLVSNQPVGPLSDLSTSITAPTSAAPGASVPFTVTVNNTGAANATDILLNATVPPGFLITGVNGSSLFNCSFATPVVTCLGGAVNQGANATIWIDTTATATQGTYKTTAVVDPENAIAENDELNNTSSHTITIPAGPPPLEPVTFTKTASSPVDPSTGTQVRPGDLLTYTITVTNTSPKWDATKLNVTDGTQGLDAASVKATVTLTPPASGGNVLVCTPSASQVVCKASNNNFSLKAGQQAVIKIEGTVVQNPSSVITNTATLQTLQSKVSITRTASVSTTVRPGVDLTVTQYSTCTPPTSPSLLPCGPFRARNQFDYLITVGNSGLNDANGVVLRVPLPNDVIFESFENLSPSAGFNCTVDSSNVVLCTGGTIPGALSSGSYPGTIRQLRLHLTAPNSIGPISATITVDPYNSIFESDETNNTFVTPTPIATGIDLTVSQRALCPRNESPSAANMCDPVAPSGTLIYDIFVQNVGTQDASGIKITNILPEGTRFRSAKEIPNPFGTPYTPDHGLSCTAAGQQVTCTDGRLKGIYAAYGNFSEPFDYATHPVPIFTVGTPDNFTIRITAFAPAPFGPNDSPTATGSPILNQVLVDAQNTIPEFNENNNLNILETNVGIPPTKGDWGTYNELTIENRQTSPVVNGAPTNVAPNGTLEYTLTAKNWGSDPVANISIEDYIPEGARFRNVTAAPLAGGNGGFVCSFASGVVTCTNGALTASPGVGASSQTTIKILLFAPDRPSDATTRYTNHAVVDPNNAVPEADETNNIADVALTVEIPPTKGDWGTFNELTVDNAQTNPAIGSVAPNGTLEYTLTIKNWGTDLVSNITLYDYIPAGARFRNVTAGPLAGGNGGFLCSFTGDRVTCTNGALAGRPGGIGTFSSTTVKILLFAPDGPNDATTHYTNHAVIDPNNTIPEADETNNVSDLELTVELPPAGQNVYNDLIVTATQVWPVQGDNPATVATNGTLRYRLKITNTGSDPARNVVVRDYLPTGTRFRSALNNNNAADGATAGSGAFACFHSNGIVECANGTVLSAGTAVIDIMLFAPDQPGDIQNQAVVNPDKTIPEASYQNNTAFADTSVDIDGIADFIELKWEAFEVSANPVGTDTEVQYTLTIKNDGTDRAFNVKVTDSLPEGSTFIYAVDANDTSGKFTCDGSGGLVTCIGGSIPGGGTRTIHIFARTPKQSDVLWHMQNGNTANITNSAMIDPGNALPEGDETNNAASLTFELLAKVDLEIIQQAGSGISQGSEGTWTFSVKNHGPDQVRNVVVETSLPVGVIVLNVSSGDSTGWFCQTEENPINKITCTGELMTSGEEVVFTVKVYTSASGSICSTSFADPAEAIAETNEDNNSKQGCS